MIDIVARGFIAVSTHRFGFFEIPAKLILLWISFGFTFFFDPAGAGIGAVGIGAVGPDGALGPVGAGLLFGGASKDDKMPSNPSIIILILAAWSVEAAAAVTPLRAVMVVSYMPKFYRGRMGLASWFPQASPSLARRRLFVAGCDFNLAQIFVPDGLWRIIHRADPHPLFRQAFIAIYFVPWFVEKLPSWYPAYDNSEDRELVGYIVALANEVGVIRLPDK